MTEIETGVKVGDEIIAFGRIIFDKISKELRMENPMGLMGDKQYMVNFFRKKALYHSRKMVIFTISMLLFGYLVFRRIKLVV